MSKVARRAAQAREVAEVAAPPVAAGTCSGCAHRTPDRHALEQGVAGLVIFGSGFGASVAASRL